MSHSRLRWPLAVVALVALGALAAPLSASAQDAAPVAAYRGDMLAWMSDAQDKLEQLATAMPEAKYTWRPGKEVRSVGEVYLHVAAANFGLPGFLGVTPPAGFKFEGYEQSMTKKAEIQKALHDSFEHMKTAFSAASEADLDKEVELMGNKMTERHVYMLILSHVHEHLGQSIAYARMNGVVPPWTAKQQEAMKQAQDKAKAGAK